MSNRGRVLVVAHTEQRDAVRIVIARRASRPSGNSMKKSNRKSSDIRPEYDFANMKGGIRGKYVKKHRARTNLVLLDPEVYKTFPTSAAVNQALRAVMTITKTLRPSTTQGRKLG